MSKDPGGDPLIIRNVEFLGGMAEKHGWRPESPLPEIAFAGRSNVGKSSLLNSLVRRKSFARVSRTPGRTREINFFRINNGFVFVDLPGYGYARVSKVKKAEWRPMIESYLRRTSQLRGIVLLLDIRREPSDDDRAMLDFLAEVEVPTIVALTKTDKLSKAGALESAAKISRALALEPEQVIPFSAHTGEGRVELLEAITALVGVTP
jgi:GTP-binding protein